MERSISNGNKCFFSTTSIWTCNMSSLIVDVTMPTLVLVEILQHNVVEILKPLTVIFLHEFTIMEAVMK